MQGFPGDKDWRFSLHAGDRAGRKRRKPVIGPPVQLRGARYAGQHLVTAQAHQPTRKSHAATPHLSGAQHPRALLLAAADGRCAPGHVPGSAGRLDPVGGQGLSVGGPVPCECRGGDQLAVLGLDVGGGGCAARPLLHPRGEKQGGQQHHSRPHIAHAHPAVRSLEIG